MRPLPFPTGVTTQVLRRFSVTLVDLLARAFFRLAFQAIRLLAAAFVFVFPWHGATSSERYILNS